MNRAGKISFASSQYILTGYRYKQCHKKWIQGIFYQGLNQSEHEAGKNSSVMLRMSVFSPKYPTASRAKYLNG